MEQLNDYQFIQVPINLFYLMDANCSKVFTTLIQMDSFYPKEDGYFECAYKTLELACGLSHPVIKASLAGLYNEGLVDVISVGKGRGKHTNRYKVCVERFNEYEKIPVGVAIMTEDKPIHQVKYKGERFQVPWDKPIEKQTEKGTEKQSEKKVSTNINNIDNIKNIDYIENINNIDNIKNIDYIENINNIENNRYEESIMYFVNYHNNYQYSLLSYDKDRFLNKYKDSIIQLGKTIEMKTGDTLSNEIVMNNIFNYVQKIGIVS